MVAVLFLQYISVPLTKGTRVHNNEEPAMRNLIIDGAAGDETKRKSISTVLRRKA
jgi:hypothetical protein